MARANAVGRAVEDRQDWLRLIDARASRLRTFLAWAQEQEASGKHDSLRVENRDDLDRCREAIPLFEEAWWGLVVYSCFDSVSGATVAAERFRQPVSPARAREEVARLSFPRGSVQHHRAQSTLKGAKRSLVSACAKAAEVRDVLSASAGSFDARFDDLRAVDVEWWGRTTCFDVILRAGVLALGGHSYRPERAYLEGSTGPAAGFAYLWGERVTKSNANSCEELLRLWTADWQLVARAVDVPWSGKPYDSGDLENALCVFQETHGGRRKSGCAVSAPRTPRC